MQATPLTVQGFDLTGASLGGIETHVCLPQLRLAIDVGRGPRTLVRCEHIALTHTHVDHAAGLPYLVAMRSFFRLPPPKIYAPAQTIDDLRALITSWNKLQRIESACEFVPMSPGETVRLRQDMELTAFRTRHVVPSLGYTVTKRTDKLADAYKGTPGEELRDLKAKGVDITIPHRTPLVTVTGDTLAEVIDDHPDIMKSKLVLLECTFLDDSKPYEAARQGGHVHLRDLHERVEAISCERLVLSHFSQLYDWNDVATLLEPLAREITGELWAWPTRLGHAPVRVGAPSD